VEVETAIADVGGVANMGYVANNNKFHWELEEISSMVEIPGAFCIGAAASKPSCSKSNDNSELVPCSHIQAQLSRTKEAYVDKETKLPVLAPYPSNSFSALGNIFLCESLPSQVLHISASKRIGPTNFVSAIRLALATQYPEQHVGLGGTFIIHQGTFKSHIMPSFPPRDMPDDNSWLTYFSTPAPVTCLSVLVNKDITGDDLRLEHTHFWSHDGNTGGHYHHDETPDTVSYEGYYAVASSLHRIDRAYPPQLSLL